jgi:hypothetical protein
VVGVLCTPAPLEPYLTSPNHSSFAAAGYNPATALELQFRIVISGLGANTRALKALEIGYTFEPFSLCLINTRISGTLKLSGKGHEGTIFT